MCRTSLGPSVYLPAEVRGGLTTVLLVTQEIPPLHLMGLAVWKRTTSFHSRLGLHHFTPRVVLDARASVVLALHHTRVVLVLRAQQLATGHTEEGGALAQLGLARHELAPFVSEDHLVTLGTAPHQSVALLFHPLGQPFFRFHVAGSTVQGLPTLYTVGIVTVGVLAIHTCDDLIDDHRGLTFRTEGDIFICAHHLLGGNASSQDPILIILDLRNNAQDWPAGIPLFLQ